MSKYTQNGPDLEQYSGSIFQVIHRPMLSGTKEKTYEIALRAPGVRLIIISQDKILMSKEYRAETHGYDYRLPGWKVFDSLGQYLSTKKEDMLVFAMEAAKKECQEETWLEVKNIQFLRTSIAGATVRWDLYYFLVDDFDIHPDGQSLETGEDIRTQWVHRSEVEKWCLSGKIREDRSVAVLLQYLATLEKGS